MLSFSRSKVKKIGFKKSDFNKSFDEDKTEIEKSLPNMQADSILLDELKFIDCKLTDDAFIPIVGFLKFVKSVDFYHNNLTCKSLCEIIKVCERVQLLVFKKTLLNVTVIQTII